MSSQITADSYPAEYAQPPVYNRVPSVEAIAKVQQGMTPAEATKDELPAALRGAPRG